MSGDTIRPSEANFQSSSARAALVRASSITRRIGELLVGQVGNKGPGQEKRQDSVHIPGTRVARSRWPSMVDALEQADDQRVGVDGRTVNRQKSTREDRTIARDGTVSTTLREQHRQEGEHIH